jgi:NAD(P)-dependent dehydrogenase (short-subunit alcohol dehydrogenase family)
MTRPVALLTGATDGIGRATAGVLARQGWDVAIVGRNPTRVADSVREVSAAAPDADVFPLIADLSRMEAVRDLARAWPRDHLDFLLLNANSITNEHVVTPDGLESNLAIGFYGRALLALALKDVLDRTPGSQVLGVVGLNLDRFDPDLPPVPVSSMKALGRWQWAWQVWLRAWNTRGHVPANTYMPGLVQTKILANEPQPMRMFVQIANKIIGVPVAKGGEELAQVVGALRADPARDVYFSRTSRKGVRALGDERGDAEKVWVHAERVLAKWR